MSLERHPRRRDPFAEHRAWLNRAAALTLKHADEGGSHHPSVKVGAVLVSADGKELVSSSNGFAAGVDRCRAERYNDGHKSLWINCAEQLALAHAARLGLTLEGTRLYVTVNPCAICAGLIAEAGIREVYVPVDALRRYADLKDKWKESLEIGLIKLTEAGVNVIAVDTGESSMPAKRRE